MCFKASLLFVTWRVNQHFFLYPIYKMYSILTLVAIVIAIAIAIVITIMLTRKSKKERFTEEKPKPKILLFHASWCKYCVEYLKDTSHDGKNAFDAASAKLQGKVEFDKPDFDENKELANKYGISSFPTIVGVSSSGDVKPFSGDRDNVNAIVDFAKSLS